jgi:hypothetical protein
MLRNIAAEYMHRLIYRFSLSYIQDSGPCVFRCHKYVGINYNDDDSTIQTKLRP